MNKYPISITTSKPLASFFYEILTFHVPFNKSTSILDLTCGKRHLWQQFLKKGFDQKSELEKYGKVTFSDKIDFGYNLVAELGTPTYDFNRLGDMFSFDAIIYDPPYFFNYEEGSRTKDERSKDYGEYIYDYTDLLNFMKIAEAHFPTLLKPQGKLIVKCSDQYQPKLRRFFPLHVEWINTLKSFNLIDIFIFGHHHISPTAFQMKDRPCSIIMHTYFLVFQRRI